MTKKLLIALVALAVLLALSSTAFARIEPNTLPGNPPNPTKGNIVANTYNKVSGTVNLNGNGDYKDYVQGMQVDSLVYSDGYGLSTHVYGTWNSPYTYGVDGYNYNDPQDYVVDSAQIRKDGHAVDATHLPDTFISGPHGGYLTSTHRCRECHAVHRAAGKFKLLRSDTRFESCDWCHGTGAGSGFNIQMDNNDLYTTEYNVGHTMGYGIDNGKWRAPDDTYPAFSPNYYMGGFSCFDCHSPHANPARLMGFDNQGNIKGMAWADNGNYSSTLAYNGETRYYSIINPGHNSVSDQPGHKVICVDCHKKGMDIDTGQWTSGYLSAVPLYMSGSWLLLKNPDREIAEHSETVNYYKVGDAEGQVGSIVTTDIVAGQEISDMVFGYTDPATRQITGGMLHQYDRTNGYPVNKIPIDWNSPMGIAKEATGTAAYTTRTYLASLPSHTGVWTVSEFCADCHDGNTGISTVPAPLFSEDRALRAQMQSGDNQGHNVVGDTTNWKGSYDVGYGHDENPRHCGRQMQFNPEDVNVFGPHCRNCHKGSSGCGRCHSYAFFSTALGGKSTAIYTTNLGFAADNAHDRLSYDLTFPGVQGQTTYAETQTTMGALNMLIDGDPNNMHVPGDLTDDSSFMFKRSRTIAWYSNWRESAAAATMTYDASGTLTSVGTGSTCGDDGFSWPHRTLGWKMLKDDLFGLNFDGTPVGIGGTRSIDPDGPTGPKPVTAFAVHDLDSVCLDCHNPTVWRATSAGNYTDVVVRGTDSFGRPIDTNSYDNHNDELLTRGLP
ncbi:MAG TPA: hypothetical protein VGK02_02070 [Candidatus Aquicultor sp.]|jgi:hypothetical protein